MLNAATHLVQPYRKNPALTRGSINLTNPPPALPNNRLSPKTNRRRKWRLYSCADQAKVTPSFLRRHLTLLELHYPAHASHLDRILGGEATFQYQLGER